MSALIIFFFRILLQDWNYWKQIPWYTSYKVIVLYSHIKKFYEDALLTLTAFYSNGGQCHRAEEKHELHVGRHQSMQLPTKSCYINRTETVNKYPLSNNPDTNVWSGTQVITCMIINLILFYCILSTNKRNEYFHLIRRCVLLLTKKGCYFYLPSCKSILRVICVCLN